MLGQWALPSVASGRPELAHPGPPAPQGWVPDPKFRSFAVVELFKELREKDLPGPYAPLVALDYERLFDSTHPRNQYAISALIV